MSKLAIKSKDIQNVPVHYPWWFGGSASCFAAGFTHPLDLVKVRLQTQAHDVPRKNMVQMFAHVLKADGITGLYHGISASLLRQITYSTTRFGVYEELKDTFFDAKHRPTFANLLEMATVSGFLGGVAGNPADILNVRMQNDAGLPPAERRNYKNAVEGMVRMTREEGLGSLFRGVWPNSTRAVLMTASQLASYDVFKRELLSRTSMGDNLTTHFAASFMAGFVATTVCSPVDVIKTRVMSSVSKESIPVLIARITAHEGIKWVFKGWVPSFIRLGPHTIFTFVFLEQHKQMYRKWKGLEL
ncbi:mitochondrial carrier [Polychaeton citri CBS 116435]|uniref:Mitochondrial carrier n=1 Tax=Polychaeton citri CBS 116435 TaxID=1314669 RepID=A0A9P4UL93_9PEZI|nr:mitochondrial carrier [Polychaeton citri CBS 116435]